MVNGGLVRPCSSPFIFAALSVSVGVPGRDELSDEHRTWTAVESPIGPDEFVIVIPNSG